MALHRLDQAKRRKNKCRRRCARVVKGLDSKSDGVTRAGSNPADVVLFLLLRLVPHFFNIHEITARQKGNKVPAFQINHFKIINQTIIKQNAGSKARFKLRSSKRVEVIGKVHQSVS